MSREGPTDSSGTAGSPKRNTIAAHQASERAGESTPMKKQPTCPLCSGRMERHKDVVVSFGPDGTTYNFAWVCTNCSAAYPIAVDVSGFFGKTEPMYKPVEGG